MSETINLHGAEGFLQTLMRDLRIQDIKDNNVLNRLSNLSCEDPYNYNNLITWLYGKVKEYIPVEDRRDIYELSTMDVIKQLNADDFVTFLDLLYQYEMRITVPKEEPTVPIPDYISFSVSRYALTDVIEELYNSNTKEIIVTKKDDNLIVKYKPHWEA